MSTPTIPAGNLFMNATLWTGDNTNPKSITNGVTGQSFQPDLVWVKARSSGQYNVLNDSVSGAGTSYALTSNATDAQGGSNILLYGATTAFNSNGFNVGGGSSNQAFVNLSGVTYVGWQWKAGGTAVSNTAGSITSQVSANTTSGFSVVTYTGNGTIPSTIGHGLGVAPQFIIIKDRSVISNWVVQHNSLGWTQGFLGISTVAATSSSAFSNNTAPTSSVFTVGAYSNNNSENYVAYCWAPIAGYSAFGSYTGNGSTDGPFVYCGFRPRWIMWKLSSTTGDWQMWDSSRDTYNVAGNLLDANLSNAEATSQSAVDFLSNGFKNRSSSVGNASGQTYIYAAFAENPLKFANAR